MFNTFHGSFCLATALLGACIAAPFANFFAQRVCDDERV